MSLGETIDREHANHIIKRGGGPGHGDGECEFCDAIRAIRKAYEEMIQSLNVISVRQPVPASRKVPERKPRRLRAELATVLPLVAFQNTVEDAQIRQIEERVVQQANDSETYESVLARDPDYIERFEPDFEKEDAA